MAKTKMTRILMAICVIVFALMSISGGSKSIENLIRFNAMSKALVYHGERWRLFCAMFIHIGIIHLFMNMYFLNIMGPIFERLYGPRNFLIIFILSGLMGNLFTYAFGSTRTVSAGASTALYGLLGLAIGIMINYRSDEILRSFGASFISIVVINIVYSLLMPGVGVLGHLGGFISGVILSGIIPIINRELSMPRTVFSLVLYIALGVIFVVIGNRSMLMWARDL